MRRLLLPLLLVTASAAAQTIPLDVEIGYRWLDLKGDRGMYRTQVNEQSGLLLRALSYSAPDFRVDVSDMGVGPAGAIRLDYGRADLFRLRFAYRTAEAFSAVPQFAQHTFNRRRDMVDVELEAMPGRTITPFIGYSTNRITGPGTSTTHLGQDEFLLRSDLHDHDREVRTGASFNTGRIYGLVMQGWRHFTTEEILTLAPGASGGNNSGPVLGRPISAGGISSISNFGGSTPFTTAFVTGQVTKSFRLIGNYTRFNADADGLENESSTGSFASFELSRFFAGLNEDINSRARNKTWRGGARGEFAVREGVDLFAGYQTEHRDLSGSALINSLFLQTITFGGADPRDVLVVLDTNSSIEREENVGNFGVSLRNLGPFAVRAEVRSTDQTANVHPDLAEIVVPGSQGGRFERRIDTFDTNATYTRNKLTLGAAWRHDHADEPIFRTDFLERERFRVRAQWATPKDLFRGGLTAEQVNQDNDRDDTGFKARLRQYTADGEVAPIEKLHLRASYSQYRANSDISFRIPQNFEIGRSLHEERGRAVEGGVAFFLTPVTFDAGTTRYYNKGSLPFKIDRYRVRTTFDFKAHAGIAAEYTKDKYRDTLFPLGDYDANRYGLFLRWRP